jgi:hypothetical protein
MKKFCVDFIIDVTASNEHNLPWSYFVMKELAEKFAQYPTEQFEFGLTVIRGGEEASQAILFSEGRFFTSNLREFLTSLIEIKTSRGDSQSVDGVDEAMKLSLDKFGSDSDILGIPVLITDCMTMPKNRSIFDYINENPVFHMFAFCPSQLIFRLRFIDAQGIEKNIEHISVKDFSKITQDNATDFVYNTIATRIANETFV